MFDTRSNSWVFMSIPAKSWKYSINPYDTQRRDYAKYPEGVVTHPKSEPFVICSNCQVPFSTDAKRKNDIGEWIYTPVTRWIIYQRATSKYCCLVACKPYVS